MGGGAYVVVEVEVRTACPAEPGDKFATRHGQKGTAGLLRRVVCQPYSCATGRPLAFVLNSIGILARLTAGHLHQMHVQKAATLVAQSADATAFLTDAAREKLVDAAATLMDHGMHPMGLERHVNGTTGELIDQPLFVGIMHVEALHHLTRLKIHARDRGPIKSNTRQADDGRARDGGRRFGRMEGDNSLANGMPNWLDDVWGGDAHPTAICGNCRMPFAAISRETGLRRCEVCMVGKHVQEVPLAYALKGFYQIQPTIGQVARLCLADAHAPMTRSVAQRALDEQERDARRPSMLSLTQVARPAEHEYARLGVPPPPSLRGFLRSLSLARADHAAFKRRERERADAAARRPARRPAPHAPPAPPAPAAPAAVAAAEAATAAAVRLAGHADA
jgi:hypothetical protein